MSRLHRAQWPSKLESAFADLLLLIARGWEYPDAHSKVWGRYKLTQRQADAISEYYSSADREEDENVSH